MILRVELDEQWRIAIFFSLSSLFTTDPTVHLSKAWLLTFCSEPKQNAEQDQTVLLFRGTEETDWVTHLFCSTLWGCVEWIISRTECLMHLHVYALQLWCGCWLMALWLWKSARGAGLVLKVANSFSWTSQIRHCACVPTISTLVHYDMRTHLQLHLLKY